MHASHPSAPTAPRMRMRSPVQMAALLLGMLFLLVGGAGFVPGATWNFEEIEMAARSEAMLLGIFQVSVLHNVVHLLFGLAGLGLSRLPGLARGYLLVGGIVYGVLWLYGLLVDKDSEANFVPLNTADDWLHFALALTMLGLTLLPGASGPPTSGPRTRTQTLS